MILQIMEDSKLGGHELKLFTTAISKTKKNSNIKK